MFKKQKRGAKTGTVVILATLLLAFPWKVNALTTESPNFPSCTTKIGVGGDWSHSGSGTQYIPGIGNREGSDDVFQMSSGNFLQCFCPISGSTGIQTNWWNIERTELSNGEIGKFKSEGWMELSGVDYNLYHEKYLAKNLEYTCKQPLATPTNTPFPSATPIPTVAPTKIPGPQSRCFDLEATPLEGSAPLTVKFTGHADDPVSGGKIKEYRFDFADTSGNQPQVWTQADRVAYHRYENPGDYEAKLRVLDNAGNWRESDDCKVKIKVTNVPQVLGTKTGDKLPETGASTVAIALASFAIGFAGIQLYRRFKLI